MRLHADVRIIGAGCGCGEQDQQRLQTGQRVRPPNEFAADTLALETLVDCQVGQIRAVGIIADGSRNSNQLVGIGGPRRDDQSAPLSIPAICSAL